MYLTVKDVRKSYGKGGSYVEVLKGISLELEKGKICMILGSSGSGKSTLLNCIGGLDFVDTGSIVVSGKEVVGLSQKELLEYRRNSLGFIFQSYYLIPNLTVRENIQLGEYLTKTPLPLDDLLENLGLVEHQNKFPYELSGGQQQRCAIGRALIKNPKLLLLDEPTGALDSKTAREILILLEKMNQTYETTMVFITHNETMKEMAHKVIRIRDGEIFEMYDNESRVSAKDLEEL